MPVSQTSDQALKECVVIAGTWTRYYGEGKGNFGFRNSYRIHRFNDDTRTVQNVTKAEYEARPYQLQPVGGPFAVERLFSPDKVTNSSIANAKGQIALATVDDLAELEKIAKRDQRKGLRPFYIDKLAKLGSDVVLPPM